MLLDSATHGYLKNAGVRYVRDGLYPDSATSPESRGGLPLAFV